VAVAALLISSVLIAPSAWADGGAGGNGGAGGSGFNGAAGGSGGAFHSGGGGGAGGGAGGSGNNGGAPGGAGGTFASPDGQNGGTDTNVGGGGGGGYNGNDPNGQPAGTGTPILNNASPLRGGNGGAGDGGGAISNGGGGGAGGYGAIVTTNNPGSNSSSITGGNGGAGGSGSGNGGSGGDGGTGLQFTNGTTSFTNTGTIQGGNGGAGGTGGGGGTAGAGGVGIAGSSLNIINSGTIAGGLSGGGVRANAITFNGGTNSLELRSGYQFTGVVAGAGANTLIFGGSTTAPDTTFDVGQIGAGQQYQGFTGFQKTGTSTWTLTGTNATAGSFGVTGGTLFVNASLANSGFTIIGGATLAGTGHVGFASFEASGGVLAPGSVINPYGTLTLAGLGFNAVSVYRVNLSPTANSSTIVTGAATIAAGGSGGTVLVNAGQGTYTTGRRTILTAGSINGTFASVSTNLAFLLPTLAYDSMHVYLDITGNAVAGGGGGGVTAIDYRTAALTLNQIAVAGSLTNAGTANGGTGAVLTALNQLTVPQARAAFDSLSGEGITAAQNVANQSSALFTSAIFDQTVFYVSDGNSIVVPGAQPGFSALAPTSGARAPIHELADLPSTKPAPVPPSPASQGTWRAWATGFGATDTFHGNALPIGSATQTDTIYGGALGVDYRLTQSYRVGVALGGSDGTFDVPNRVTSGSTTGGHVAFYDIADFGPFYGASSTAFSYFTSKTTRSVAGFGGLGGETERGTFDSHEFRSRLEFGRHVEAFGATLTPFVALELAELRSNGFGETALSGPGNFALNVSGQSEASAPGFIGARFQSVMPLGGLVFAPSLQLAYVHEFAPQRTDVAALASLPGSTFLVDGARPARDAAQVKAGGEITLTTAAILFANFEGEFAGVSQSYAGKSGLKLLW
jgi:uncharacterized protein with beta-barrel porin domain